MNEHCCTQEEQISKLNLLLLGNGNPQDGYIFKVMQMTKKVEDIETHLTGISGMVKDLHEESIGKKAIDKKEKNDFDINNIAQNLQLQKKGDNWYKILTILGLAVAIYFGFHNGKKSDATNKKIENLGEPVVVNFRGQMVGLPNGYSLKMFPKDFVKKDTIK